MEEAAMRRALKSRLGIEVDGEVTAYHRELLADAEQQDKQKGKKDYWWMPFGKHKGKSFKKIHAESPGYLPYLLQKRMVSDPGLRANMITFLKKRRDDASNWVRSQIDMALAEYTS